MPRSTKTGSYCTENIGHLDEHLDWMRRCDRAERTIRARRMVLTWLAEYLGHDPATATEAELDRWQSTLDSREKLRWQTLVIRPYYRWLQARGVRPDNPAALLPVPKRRRRLPRPIPEDRLFAAVVEAPPRILPWLLLAGWCGLRAHEIANLWTNNFSAAADGAVWVRFIGKGDAERDVPVPDWVWAVIGPRLPEGVAPCWRRVYKPDSGPVTAKQLSDTCSRYFASRGVPDRLHSLRHRVATSALGDSRDLRLVQELMGHANLSTLHVYTQVQSRDLAAVVNRIPRPPLRLVVGTGGEEPAAPDRAPA